MTYKVIPPEGSDTRWRVHINPGGSFSPGGSRGDLGIGSSLVIAAFETEEGARYYASFKAQVDSPSTIFR